MFFPGAARVSKYYVYFTVLGILFHELSLLIKK